MKKQNKEKTEETEETEQIEDVPKMSFAKCSKSPKIARSACSFTIAHFLSLFIRAPVRAKNNSVSVRL